MADENHAETIERLAIRAVGEPGIIKLEDGRTFAILPEGFHSSDITEQNDRKIPQPLFVQQGVAIHTVQSLIDYTNRFQEAGRTVIFADLDKQTISAAIDYHAEPGVTQQAGLRKHNAMLALRQSEEWKIWTGRNDKWMLQSDFAEFLTENGQDAVFPSGFANLQELVMDLQGEEVIRVVKRMNRAHSNTGNAKVETSSQMTGLPAEIEVHIPLFFGEDPVNIRIFIKDRLGNGEFHLGYRMVRLEMHRQAELTRIANKIGADTGVPVIIGATS